MSDGKGFKNIEKTEKYKSDHDNEEGLFQPEEGDEESHHFIDHDPLIILFTKELLGSLRNPNRKKEEAHQCQFVDWRGDFRENKIEGNGQERSKCSRDNGRIANSKTGS